MFGMGGWCMGGQIRCSGGSGVGGCVMSVASRLVVSGAGRWKGHSRSCWI